MRERKPSPASSSSTSCTPALGRVARSLELGEITDAFEKIVNVLVAELAPKHAFVRAGVVGWRGRVVVPGFNQSGKTTLTAALVRAGATYYSDEYAVFNQRGYVQPFARPLRISAGDGEPRKIVTPEELGGESGLKPLPLGLVVETKYREACQWRPRPRHTGPGRPCPGDPRPIDPTPAGVDHEPADPGSKAECQCQRNEG